MTGAEAFLQVLRRSGVRYVFGVPGTTEVALIDELAGADDIQYILGLHEGVVVAMADGYYRGGGGPGVVSLHTTMGTANALSMCHSASKDRSAVVVTAGNKSSRILGRDCFCEAPFHIADLPRQFTKWSWEVTRPERIPEALVRALKVATAPPAGPVFLSIPEDLLAAEGDFEVGDPKRFFIGPTVRGDQARIEEAAQMLKEAENPVLLMGNEVGRMGALQEAAALAELVGAPVVTEEKMGLTNLNFPADHLLYRGTFRPELVSGADVLLAVGAGMFTEFAPPEKPWVPGATRVIHIHRDPWEIGKIYQADVAVVADARSALVDLYSALDGLLDESTRKHWAERLEFERRRGLEAARAREEEMKKGWGDVPIRLTRLLAELRAVAPSNTVVVNEGIMASPYLQKYFPMNEPGSYHATAASSLGWGFPAALGVKLAQPERPVVAFVGDGSFCFTPQSLWTAARYRIPVVGLIVNNRAYMAVKAATIGFGGKAARRRVYPGSELVDPAVDFVGLARSFGVEAKRVVEPTELRPALEGAFAAGGPVLVEVVIEPKDTEKPVV